MKDKDKQINNKDDIDPKPTDDDLSYIARNKAFFVDEETSTENLHKHTKERLKHEKSVFRKSIECFKKVINSSGTENSFYSENKISLQKVGIFTPLKKMVVPSTGITIHPKGLVNKRNDCFLNATMQVLLSIKSFGDYYYTCKDQKILSIALKEFINNYSKNKYLNPEKLISQLRCKMKFIDGNEQDAHEFLVSLLNILYIEQGGTDSIITSQDELEETQRTNYIAKTFYGMQKNIILCLKCNNKSEGYQETSILSCELQKNVESVLHEYTKSEKILYDCPKCGMTEGIKKFEIVSHSKIMIIHLKRFNHNGRKNYTKIDVCRDFDFYGSYYRLLGAIVHIGDTESGHYYSEAIRNGKWVRFDDMVIQDIEENKNDLRDAYILFYERTNKL